MTTHDVNVSVRCCDRIVVLDKANLIFDVQTAQIDTAAFTQDYLLYARGKN